MIIPFKTSSPRIAESAFVAPDAWVIGDVEIADEVSIFYCSVLRGDILPIRVGPRTNIQEHSMLHTSNGRAPTIVGADVTIGHRAVIHGCTIEDCVLIGMGAIVLDEAIVGTESLIGAGAIVTEGARIPPRSLVLGIPGKVVRTLSDEEVQQLKTSADHYVETGQEYRNFFAKTL